MCTPPELERRHVKFCLSPHPSTMQSTSSYCPPPCKEDPVLRGWLRSDRLTKTPSLSSTSYALSDDEDLPSPVLESPTDDVLYVSSTDWALSTRRGDPFASQTSVSFIPDVVELPEIPFIAPTPTSSTSCDDEDEDSLWPDSMQRSASNSSSERQIAVLGQASPRAVSHTRGRSGSLSSTASRPAPARSILSSSSSIKTRKGRAPPSVKFLDMPTIHYDEDEDTDGPRSHAAWPTSRPARSAPPSATAPSKKRVFGILNWLTSPAKKKAKTAPTRPSISGPFPLCEAPSRRSSDSSRPCDSAMDARSIRSVRSTSSMRSVRSCASRIQGYWGRLSGKDP